MIAWGWLIPVGFVAAIAGFFVAAPCHAAGDADAGKPGEERRR